MYISLLGTVPMFEKRKQMFQVPECENEKVCPQEQDLLGLASSRAKDQQSIDHLCGKKERLRESENSIQIRIQAAEERQYD